MVTNVLEECTFIFRAEEYSEDGSSNVLLKHWLISYLVHGVTSHKTVIFIVTTIRTQNIIL
jgi:hypothetical protein